MPVAIPEPSDLAVAYYHARIALWAAGLAWTLGIPALILFTGASARIRDFAQRTTARPMLQLAIYVACYSAIAYLLSLPLVFYDEFVTEHRFGLSNQSFAKWLTDSLIVLAITTIMGYGIVAGVYRALRKSPRRWWLWSAVIAIPFVFLATTVAPIWFDPLFNDFTPMKDRALEAKILALADRAGIEGSRVYEVDKSVDTKTTNAYVNGFLTTKRIVLWDTIIARLDEKELLFVMAHEMGHYALGHVWQLALGTCALILACLFAIHKLAHRLMRRHARRFGFERLDDMASLPLLILVGGAALVVAGPIFNLGSRYTEHEADRFGLEVTQDNHAAASAFVKLQRDNLGVPRPNALVHLLRGTHPTLAERIEFANSYKPWARGEPLRYGERIKP